MPYKERPDSASLLLLLVKEPNDLIPKVPLVYDPKRATLYPGQKPFYKWPGGHFDPDLDRNEEDTAVREGMEETGIHNMFARDIRKVWEFQKPSRGGGFHTVHIFVGCIFRKLILFHPKTGERMKFFTWEECQVHPDVLNTHKMYARDKLVTDAIAECARCVVDNMPGIAL